MRRLNGVDAGFVYTDRPTQPCTPIFVVELGAPHGSPGCRSHLTLPELRQLVLDRLDLVPSFRWKLQRVPLGLNHPVWVWDSDFDIDFHLHHATAEPPGDNHAFDRIVADMSEIQLDQKHPMWKITLVDGLPGQRQALLFCVHHSMVDAVAALNLMKALLDDVSSTDLQRHDFEVEHPATAKLILSSLSDQLSAWRSLRALILQARSGARSVRHRRKVSTVKVPKFQRKNKACLLNASYSANRVFARSTLRLEDLKLVRTVGEVTMNELLLAVTASALRSYLTEREAVPSRPVVAGVPVALPEKDGRPRQWGCNIAQYLTYLAIDIEDPWDRLNSVAICSREGRLRLDLGGIDTAPKLVEYLFPFMAIPALKFLSKRHAKRPELSMSDLLVSNIPAPTEKWSSRLGTVEGLWISGPPVDGSGLNITFTGYGSQMAVAVRSNPSAIESPGELVDKVGEALAELVREAEKRVGKIDQEPEKT